MSIPSHLVPAPITASLSWTCKKSSAKALADGTSSITTNSHHHRSGPARDASVHRIPRMSRTTGRFQVEAGRSRQQSTAPLIPKITMPGSPVFRATNTSLHCAHCAGRGASPAAFPCAPTTRKNLCRRFADRQRLQSLRRARDLLRGYVASRTQWPLFSGSTAAPKSCALLNSRETCWLHVAARRKRRGANPPICEVGLAAHSRRRRLVAKSPRRPCGAASGEEKR
jgi:hypothetical protein